MTDHTIGVDISKSHLDVFRLEDGAAQRFDNSAAGFRALIKWLGKAPVARIVYEPTGPYHRGFETALSGRFPLVKVNPLQARRFAQASGTRAKTDATDCARPSADGRGAQARARRACFGSFARSQGLAGCAHGACQGAHALAQPRPDPGQPRPQAPDQNAPPSVPISVRQLTG